MSRFGRFCLAVLLAAGMLAGAAASAETISFRGFRADTEAEELDLGKTEVRRWEEFYEFLSRMPKLKKVNLFASHTGAEVVEELHRRFPEIEFGLTLHIGSHIVRTDATAFSTLYNHGDRTYGYGTISQIRYCRQMYALDIGHNKVGNLDFLYDMPQLRVLIVALCDVTDITPIASLEHLEYLEIFHNGITDISCLASLEHLMDLNLVKNNVSDLTPLTRMKSLKRLWIHECNQDNPGEPTAKTVAMLREALPDCVVDAESTSTGGGWRSHPHYYAIRRMFRRKAYEPFEDSDPDNLPEEYRERQGGK